MAKEQAKQALVSEQSSANIAFLGEITKMLEKASQAAPVTLPDMRSVIQYASSKNRKLGKTKLYDDVNKKGLLKRQADGSFKIRDVDFYLSTVPVTSVTDASHDRAMDRQRRKEEAEIRRLKASAERAEFDLAVRKGEYVARDTVYLELAARAVTLSSNLKTAFEAQILDIISLAEGNPQRSVQLIDRIESLVDEAMSEYSREIQLDVDFQKVSDMENANSMGKGEHVDDTDAAV